MRMTGLKALTGATLAADTVAALVPSMPCTFIVLQNTHASGDLFICDSAGVDMWSLASGERMLIPCNHTNDVKVRREAGVAVTYIGGIGI